MLILVVVNYGCFETELLLSSKEIVSFYHAVLYRALGYGVRMTAASAVMSMTQCSAWMPIPHSWMSWESTEPTFVCSYNTTFNML